jgi:hypothetical protein
LLPYIFSLIKDNTLEIINVAGLILNPGSVPDLQLVDEDPCEATCSIGIKDKATGEVTKYMFDQPNGCIAKGYAPDNKINTFFNNCCDDHSKFILIFYFKKSKSSTSI